MTITLAARHPRCGAPQADRMTLVGQRPSVRVPGQPGTGANSLRQARHLLVPKTLRNHPNTMHLVFEIGMRLVHAQPGQARRPARDQEHRDADQVPG